MRTSLFRKYSTCKTIFSIAKIAHLVVPYVLNSTIATLTATGWRFIWWRSSRAILFMFRSLVIKFILVARRSSQAADSLPTNSVGLIQMMKCHGWAMVTLMLATVQTSLLSAYWCCVSPVAVSLDCTYIALSWRFTIRPYHTPSARASERDKDFRKAETHRERESWGEWKKRKKRKDISDNAAYRIETGLCTWMLSFPLV